MEKRNPAELMYVQCAYCREWLDVKPGKMNEISHTICPKCAKKVMAEHSGRKKRRKANPRG